MTVALREETVPNSVLSRWDARWKLAGLTLAVVAILTLRNHFVLGACLGLVTAFVLLGRVSISTVLQRWGFLSLSLLPVVLMLGLCVENGGQVALAILLRTSAVAGILLVLVLTTSISTLCAASHQLGIPGVIIQVVALAWRYARLFLAELQRIRMALFCRGFRLNTTSHAFRTLGYTAGTLMIQGADRSERVSEAMLARGFQGHYHNLHEFRSTRRDVLGFLVSIIAFGGLVLWDRLT